MSDRVDVGSIRRGQIVEAACRVIRSKGIQGASLAEIEQEAGISRGVLTYHFPTKESIMLAVFDATIARMKEEAGASRAAKGPGFDQLEDIVDFLLTRKPRNDDFDCLQYTFLAQMSHREDFRDRLATEHADIRRFLAREIAERATRAGMDAEEVRTMAAVIHGTLIGLILQINIDPDIADRQALARIVKAMIIGYFDRRAADVAGASKGRGRPGKAAAD